MKELIEAMEKLPLAIKIFLALPFFDVIWVAYRLFLSLEAKKAPHTALAAVLFVVGLPFLWLVDIITLAAYNRIIWFKEARSTGDSR